MKDKTVLLVEDNRDDEALTLRALEKGGFANAVVVVRDGAEALDYIFGRGEYAGRNAKVLPAIVLLDIKLPKIDGLEVLKRIRANPATKFLPVVVMTSSRHDHDVIAGYDLGANSFVIKPVDFDQFAQAIGHLGLYWLLLNEPPRQ